jgi:hypothetical protein
MIINYKCILIPVCLIFINFVESKQDSSSPISYTDEQNEEYKKAC